MCPFSQPYSFNGGTHCCRFYQRSLNLSADTLCDGVSPLLHGDPLACCYEYVECANDSLCVNHDRAEFEYLTILRYVVVQSFIRRSDL